MATTDKAYCAESDVIAYAQTVSDYDATTTPTEAQLLQFMEQRAADLFLVLHTVMGTSAPGPSGYANPITVGNSDAEFALNEILVQANAVGVAMDALAASGAGEEPARSERVTELGVLYEGLVGRIREHAEGMVTAITGDATSASHLTIGEITNPTVVSRERDPFDFDQTTEF